MKRDFKSSETFGDGKYKVLNISHGDTNLRRVVCETDSICIIPFDTNGRQIKNVYLAKYMDYLTDQKGHTCVSMECKSNPDSEWEEISSIIKNELALDADVNDVFFLGKIQHNLPFTKSYKCYGLNLDKYSKDLNGFTLDISDDEKESKLYQLDKIRFTRVLNGDIEDSLTLSAALLLISYMS